MIPILTFIVAAALLVAALVLAFRGRREDLAVLAERDRERRRN